MVREYVLAEAADLIEVPLAVATDFNGAGIWWRGQSSAEWSLQAGVYRERYVHVHRPDFEANIINRFKNGARVRRPDCPHHDDSPGWLLLAQHYGLPTRLLDWTESFLTACLFAVGDQREGDAAIWALEPTGFNMVHGSLRGFYPQRSDFLASLFGRAFNPGIDEGPFRHFAVLGEHSDYRMMLQSAHFTVHDEGTPIDHMPLAEFYLRKIIIPADRRIMWKKAIHILGIRRELIFPDLQNLADSLLRIGFNSREVAS